MVEYSKVNVKLSDSQLNKIKNDVKDKTGTNTIQSGGFLSRLLGPLIKTGLPLTKNVTKPLAQSVLIPLGLTAAASAADAGIHKIGIWLSFVLRVTNNNFNNFK